MVRERFSWCHLAGPVVVAIHSPQDSVRDLPSFYLASRVADASPQDVSADDTPKMDVAGMVVSDSSRDVSGDHPSLVWLAQ